MPAIRIDIGCDRCGGKHEIYLPSNKIGNPRAYNFNCPKEQKPVSMPAMSFLSMEAVTSIPASGVIATIGE